MSSVDFLDALSAALGQREAQRHVPERHLAPGVDHGLHRHAAHDGIRHEQPVQKFDGNGRVSTGRALVLRAHDRDAVAAKVDVDALVGEPVDAEYPVCAAERVGDDRQPTWLHQDVADLQRLDRHQGHGRGPRRAAQNDGLSRIDLEFQRLHQAGREGGMTRAGRHHKTIRAFTVDLDRSPDPADSVDTRGRDVARLFGSDDDEIEGHRVDAQRRRRRQYPDVRQRIRERLGAGEQDQ
jgi:hypothetical protein